MTATLGRRLAALEAQLAAVRGAGCADCAGLPDYPLEWGDPTHAALAPCLTMGGPCAGCARCQARSGWPEGFRCPGCGRAPVLVVTISYVDGADWRAGPARRPGGEPAAAPPARAPEPEPDPEEEPEPEPRAVAPAERSPAQLLAEAQAVLASLKAAAAGPDPEASPAPVPEAPEDPTERRRRVAAEDEAARQPLPRPRRIPWAGNPPRTRRPTGPVRSVRYSW